MLLNASLLVPGLEASETSKLRLCLCMLENLSAKKVRCGVCESVLVKTCA